ncbi:LuxR family transcriptional regulator [Herbiconiux sp. KACC 21604]|uniref:LuxR family transcriptional regulator n=1 Tax=unclassified Herbiconiux TaxID=2618217 RepID=UPI0014929E18|nr:LuxR family transcriptional regulator [Herbiconiux sp. SALV-R1]QJU54301.1 helix-turn-helix domain-containing protein [Herbiconiux sp. SALV-R1]WPO85371.1 LuxR family transcriptional regulator [Herbiconiux sp. KACC 21604]
MPAHSPAALPTGSTRLHGRDRALKRLVGALTPADRPVVALVTGARGVGRSALLEAAIAALGPERRVISVHGRSELSGVPLGAFAPVVVDLVPGPAAQGAGAFPAVAPTAEAPTSSSGELMVALHRAVAQGALLVVDDVHDLDASSLCVLEQLCQAGSATLLLSCPTPAPTPAGRAAAAPAAALSRLTERATLVVDLAALTAAESHDVVKDRLGPSVSTDAADEMHRLAAGSTRTLVALADAAVCADDLHDVGAAWHTSWPYLSAEVVASLPADPLAADEFVGDLLTLLAIAGDLPVEQAGTSGVSARSTALAEERGFVRTRSADGRVWVSLAHPLFEPVILPTVSELWRAGFCAAGADMLDGYPEHRVRRAVLQLSAGQRVDSRRLLDLAHGELGAQRYATTVTLGEHAVAGAGDDAVLRASGELVQAQAQSQIGRLASADERFAAAWAALAAADHDGSNTGFDDFAARLAVAEGNHLAFRTLQPELALRRAEEALARLTDDASREIVEAEAARWRLLTGARAGSVASGGADAGGIADAPPLDLDRLGEVTTPADLNLLILTAMLHTMGGDLALAETAVARGLEACERFPADLPNARDQLHLSRVLVLSFTGRFPEARQAARDNLACAEENNPSARGLWKFVLAMIELHTGSPARAWEHIRSGRRDLVWRDTAGLLPVADALSAAIAARTGRFAIARSWLDQVGQAGFDDAKVELYAALARAWVSSAAGRPGFAVRSLAPALAAAEAGGYRYLAALVAYEAVRIDPVVGATVTLPYLAAVGDALPLCEAHARAVLGRHDVMPVAEAFAEKGMLGPAIDAARWVAENTGDAPRAAQAARLADQWTVRAGVALAQHRRQLHPRVMPLTDREWQLARGAAALRTSAELAEQHGISVRTVDNHLSRIYKKLGISGRRELAAELQNLQLDSPYESLSSAG